MKRLKLPIILILTILFVGSCSDDPSEPEFEEDQFGFGLFNDENLIDGLFFISFPEAMANAQDQCAFIATSMVNVANAFVSVRGFFFPALARERSTDPIMALNGHSNYRVYTWSPDGGISTLAIQFSEASGKNYQLVFLQENSGPFIRFLESSENKEGTEGKLDVYGADDDQALINTYEWKVLSDNSREIIVSDPSKNNFFVKAKGNTDLSGSIEYRQDGQNTKLIQWDSAGNGTWQELDGNGSLVDEGSWTVS